MELQPFLLKITYLLVILLFITFRIIVASFSTILTNHDGYTILKNLTTHTYTECYLYCKRTPGCDDVEVTYGDDGKNEQRRCLILKLRKIEADCSRKKWRRITLIDSTERKIITDTQISLLDELTVEYILSFDLKLTKYTDPGKIGYIIHLTTGGYSGKYGTRTPYIAFMRTRFAVRSAVNDMWEWGYGYNSETDQRSEFQLNKWYNVKVKQVRDDQDTILYSVEIDGKVVQSVINTKPMPFRNVKVYMSYNSEGRPNETPQDGYVRNFSIDILNPSVPV